MIRLTCRNPLMAFALILLAPSVLLAQGQGDYFNVESPQVHPIELARISGHDYLLITNTPDNSVEIWDTDESVPLDRRFLARVPVGLEPVSVRWMAELERFYTANFLGDSVTVVRLEAPGGPNTLQAIRERTEFAGDEPQDVALAAVDVSGVLRQTLVVPQRSPDGFAWIDAFTLQPILPGVFTLDSRLPSGQDIDNDGQLDDLALKEPRTATVACNTLFVLGEKGGNTAAYDVDLHAIPLGGGPQQQFGKLGSTNFAMEFDVDDTLYVTGGMALNTVRRDEPVVAAAPTGFVEHRLYRVDALCSGSPNIDTRDLNFRGIGGSGQVLPVPAAVALAQPTDLEVVRTGDADQVRVYMAAFGSDRVGILEGSASQPLSTWARRTIDIRPGALPVANPAGSRGLAFKRRNQEQQNDPGQRLYVLNRISNTVTVIDGATETVLFEFPLLNDPTPADTRVGRTFLYSARFDAKGVNSCASCHVDGRTDRLAWDLGDPGMIPVGIPSELFGFPLSPSEFPADKEHMVTQSLQGLLNFEIEPVSQDLVTNAPYHWRGDRPTFLDFNGAFVSLLGARNELEDGEMERFRTFINNINYPGNPRQPLGRDYSGDFLGTEGINSTGATLGMVAFHLLPTVGTASCVHCHTLPEGSNNLLTEFLGATNPHDLTEVLANQPSETAAMRGLFQKEARLSRNGSEIVESQPITGVEGLFHSGFLLESAPSLDHNATGGINSFVRNFNALTANQLEDEVSQYTHELDWGVAPIVGISYTVDTVNLAAPLTTSAFNLFEGQVLVANAGLAVQARIAGVNRGFYYDAERTPAAYREEPGGAVFTRAALASLLATADDRLVAISTPLGSARRVAHPNGRPLILPGPAPSAPELLAMVPNTANADIPQMIFNWASGGAAAHGGASAHMTRLLQLGLIQSSPPGENAFGLGAVPRHDAPRRFRVAARNLRPGAFLEVFLPVPAGFPGAITTLPPSPFGQQPVRRVRLPIYPTDDRVGEEGIPVWETAVELDPLEYYTIMLGGLGDTSVAAARADNTFMIPEAPLGLTFNAAGRNWVYTRVGNADGTMTVGGWQRLRI